MTNFISFIYNSRDYLTLFLAIFLSLFLISSNDNPAVSSMRGIVLDSYRFIQKPIFTISDLMKVRKENKIIRRKNIELSVMVSNLREARIENERLRNLLSFSESKKVYEFVSSEVIGYNMGSFSNSIILDAGLEKGISKNTPVVNSDGVVGKVIDAGEKSSVVQLLDDQNFRIAVTINPGGANGILHGNRGLSDLKEVPKGLMVTVGDTVVTSGYSDIYPIGLMVGIVRSVDERPEYFFKDIKVKPFVTMAKLKEVLLLLDLNLNKGVTEK
ncbi:MAG: rod shape-determining protein MreC [Candidatus Marinimicrobia bacterium]|nr:rod shape-determining protein MreC [Candidatus Neomarinimicrobiota bacterium]